MGMGELTLLLEVEVLSQVAALVITPQHEELVWEVHLQTTEIQDAFTTEHPSINIVSEEEVSRFSGASSNVEKLHQIEILAMNVTADCSNQR